MGLLDEAIREHLDLKRRRGADPTEVERLEREALGPVRRVAQEPPDGQGADGQELGAPVHEGPQDEPYGEAEFAVGDEFEHEGEFAPEHDDEYEDEDENAYEDEEPHTDEPSPYAASGRPLTEEPDAHGVVPPPESPPAPAPEPSEPGHAEPPAHHDLGDLGAETAEYDVEAAHAREDEDDEDMLEETPEFLQDAPDHDRLWFEQRPPRDFDFDG
jgi:hypothetical protein